MKLILDFRRLKTSLISLVFVKINFHFHFDFMLVCYIVNVARWSCCSFASIRIHPLTQNRKLLTRELRITSNRSKMVLCVHAFSVTPSFQKYERDEKSHDERACVLNCERLKNQKNFSTFSLSAFFLARVFFYSLRKKYLLVQSQSWNSKKDRFQVDVIFFSFLITTKAHAMYFESNDWVKKENSEVQ